MKKKIAFLLLVGCAFLWLVGCTQQAELPEKLCVVKSVTTTLSTGESFTTDYEYDNTALISEGNIFVNGSAVASDETRTLVQWLYATDGDVLAQRSFSDGSFSGTYSDYSFVFDNTLEALCIRTDFLSLEKAASEGATKNYILWFEDGSKKECTVTNGKILSLRSYSADGNMMENLQCNANNFITSISVYGTDGALILNLDYEFEMRAFVFTQVTE